MSPSCAAAVPLASAIKLIIVILCDAAASWQLGKRIDDKHADRRTRAPATDSATALVAAAGGQSGRIMQLKWRAIMTGPAG